MSFMASLLLGLATWAVGPEESAGGLPAFEMDPVVVTAEGLETKLDTATASTFVITESEIRARGTAAVADLLREAAGVQILRGGTPGKATTARLRGGNANQTLVLMDGVELNSATLGVFTVNR